MSKKLSASLGQKVDQAKSELAYGSKVSEAQRKLDRERLQKSLTLARENIKWIDELARKISYEKNIKMSSSALINAFLDKARIDNPEGQTLDLLK